MKKYILLGFLSVIAQLSFSQWVQQGTDIDAEAAFDQFGTAVSMNFNGTRLAVGGPFNDGNGSNAGHVRVYEFQGDTWVQLGSDIEGESSSDLSGESVSLSANGNRVAIGAPQNEESGVLAGHARVYEYNGADWVQLGADIDAEAAGDNFGLTVSLNSIGNRLAVGGNLNDGNGADSGHARIFEFDGVNWIQLGADIDGEAAGDECGFSVDLSNGGDRVAIGSRLNAGSGANAGHTRVFEYNGIDWVQLGMDIDAESGGDTSGFSVSLNNFGSRVAIGAIWNTGNGFGAGHTRIFEFNGLNWVQVGSDIDGEGELNLSGFSVSLSNNGDRVAIGAFLNSDNGNSSGQTRLYEFNGVSWVQLGTDINGEAANDQSGYSVSLSADGSRVAIGAPYNSTSGADAGHARVYADPASLYILIPDPNFEQALIDQGIDSEGLLDGQIRLSDIIPVTGLDVSGLDISDLTGIESFESLEVLHCEDNRLSSLNMSNNLNLQELWCGFNRLFDIDVSNNVNLTMLSCPRNRISGLEVSANTGLSLLYVHDNIIEEGLDLRNLPLLTEVNTTNNPDLLCIQVDDAPAADAGAGIYANWLKDPGASYSETCALLYTAIPDPNFEQALINLEIDSEEVLDGQVLTSDIAPVTFLIIPGENISDLTGIEAFTALQQLICNNNNLSGTLAFTSHTGLTYLDCSNNQLTGIDVSISGNLTELYANGNNLTGTLNLMGNPSLEEFNGVNNPLLTCIGVTDATAANAGTGIYANWLKDMTAGYSENCGMMAKDMGFPDIKTPESEAIAETITVYPNPVQERLYIAAPETVEVSKVTLYNLQGEIVALTNTTALSVTHLPEGLYIAAVQIQPGNGVIYKKIRIIK